MTRVHFDRARSHLTAIVLAAHLLHKYIKMLDRCARHLHYMILSFWEFWCAERRVLEARGVLVGGRSGRAAKRHSRQGKALDPASARRCLFWSRAHRCWRHGTPGEALLSPAGHARARVLARCVSSIRRRPVVVTQSARLLVWLGTASLSKDHWHRPISRTEHQGNHGTRPSMRDTLPQAVSVLLGLLL